MGAVTYPDPDVTRFVNERFSRLRIDLTAKHADFKEASGASRVIFAPTFLFTDSKGREIRRYLGWLPPSDFLGELGFALGMFEFNRGEFLAARDRFQEVVDGSAEADVVPEALYWHGIAGFLGGKFDGAALASSWNAVRERFPDSTWATRAEVIDDM